VTNQQNTVILRCTQMTKTLHMHKMPDP